MQKGNHRLESARLLQSARSVESLGVSVRVLVAGGGGFIGGHLVKRLLSDGHQVRSIDIKPMNEWFQVDPAAENVQADLSLLDTAIAATNEQDWVFNLAADMGGMGFIENNKALCMLSSLINTHLLMGAKNAGVQRFFFSSSACVYASWHQDTTSVAPLKETDAYPADPEDGYGWEKLFAERMCRHFYEDFGLETRVGRYHNVYGPWGSYDGGREKAPAAACRKLANVSLGGSNVIEMWGDGQQVRSFTYIDDCLDGTLRLMESDFREPLNIGSAESVTIQELYDTVQRISGVAVVEYVYDLSAPQGVRGRSSDNDLCSEVLGWVPAVSLEQGLRPTYEWIRNQMSEGERH